MENLLTPKQKQLFEYLDSYISKNETIPSLRQAASDLGISHTCVSQFIKVLEEKGMLTRGGRYSRSIQLLKSPTKKNNIHRMKEVPIIGSISAGLPLYAQKEWDGSIVVDAGLYPGANLFALRVKGDSMKDAAILSGDIAICEPCQFAQDGEVVVALIHNEEATVKRFYYRKKYIELRPENQAYKPVKYDFNEILIQGKVIGIYRGPELI